MSSLALNLLTTIYHSVLPPQSRDTCVQRPAETQDPDDGGGEGSGSAPAKKSAPAGFSFRPSPLHKATESFILRQSAFAPTTINKLCEISACECICCGAQVVCVEKNSTYRFLHAPGAYFLPVQCTPSV